MRTERGTHDGNIVSHLESRSSLGAFIVIAAGPSVANPRPGSRGSPASPRIEIPCRTQSRPRGRFCCAFLELFGAFFDAKFVPLAPAFGPVPALACVEVCRVQRSSRSDVVTGGAHCVVEFVWNVVVFFPAGVLWTGVFGSLRNFGCGE